jgi:hypothetical protein
VSAAILCPGGASANSFGFTGNAPLDRRAGSSHVSLSTHYSSLLLLENSNPVWIERSIDFSPIHVTFESRTYVLLCTLHFALCTLHFALGARYFVPGTVPSRQPADPRRSARRSATPVRVAGEAPVTGCLPRGSAAVWVIVVCTACEERRLAQCSPPAPGPWRCRTQDRRARFYPEYSAWAVSGDEGPAGAQAAHQRPGQPGCRIGRSHNGVVDSARLR